MVDATTSRARMRDLARRGRYRSPGSHFAAPRRACASRPASNTEASSLAVALRPRPRAASSRPGSAIPSRQEAIRAGLAIGTPKYTRPILRGGRMSRRFVPVLALVALLVLASDAAATVGGPCTVEIGGEDIGPREVGAFSEPILVSSDRPVSVTMSSEQELDRLEVEMEVSGFRWTVHERPSTGTSWASEIPVDDYSDYGLGIFKVVASSSGEGFTCESSALIEITGEDDLSA